MSEGSDDNMDVIALDLEGTLISDAESQRPRPGLRKFLVACKKMAGRVVMFTAVKEDRFRAVARSLVNRRYVPHWFENMEYISWSGFKKDLRFIPRTNPELAVLVDDYPDFVLSEQVHRWIKIESFQSPYSSYDAELSRALKILEKMNE